jgi:DNA polymerase-4
MESDFKKPDQVNTLFFDEIKEKMWPLPVQDMFMVGHATTPKLHKLNIFTIGDLANYDLDILRYSLKSHGVLIWNFANGNEDSEVRKSNYLDIKGLGNSTTTTVDVDDRDIGYLFIKALSETVGMRLRSSQNYCRLISISLRNKNFESYSRQRKLFTATDSTRIISRTACELFDEVWKGEPIRNFGVSVGALCSNEFFQYSVFDEQDIEKQRNLDSVLDKIRIKYGPKAVIRSVFIDSGVLPMLGGVNEDNNFPVMSSLL